MHIAGITLQNRVVSFWDLQICLQPNCRGFLAFPSIFAAYLSSLLKIVSLRILDEHFVPRSGIVPLLEPPAPT
jgi:hypothetical protein